MQDVHEVAVQNMVNNRTPEIRNMAEVIADMMGVELDDLPPVPEKGMFVLTTSDKMFGAAAVLDGVLMKNFIEDLGEDVYIIPSSVNELLLVPKSVCDVKALKSMVREVNETEVEPKDRLSDSIYKYDQRTRTLKIADKEKNREDRGD